MNVKIKMTALLLALLLLLGTLVGCGGYVDPLGYLKDATEKTLKQTLVGEVLALLLDVSDKGSVAVDFGGTDLVQGLPEAAQLKLWIDADDRKLAADGKMTLKGQQYDLAAYLNETEMAVDSAAFLGSNTLGVDFLTLKDDLKTSIFSNNSGTAFADPAISAASADRVEQIKKSFFKLVAYSEKTVDFVDEVLETFLDELTSYAENVRYREDGYTHITLSINNDSLARALRATRNTLVKDRSFTQYLNDLAAALDTMVSASTGVTDTTYATQVRYFLSNEADINALCQRIDDAEPFTLKLNAAVKSFGMTLEDVRVTFTQSDVTRLSAALHLGEGDLGFDLTLDGVTRSFTYAVQKNGFRTYRADLVYRLSAPDVTAEIAGELLADKRAGTYSLTLHKGSETRVFGGKYDFGVDEMMLSVDSANVNGEEKRISLSLTLAADKGVPMMPKYVNVVTVDVKRFTPIYERAAKTCDQLLGDWSADAPSACGVWRDFLSAIGLPEEIPQKSE